MLLFWFSTHTLPHIVRIDKFGLTYFSEWLVGRIGDRWSLGNMVYEPLEVLRPQWLLLLCLDPTRFVKADISSLYLICKDFNLAETIPQAIVDWGWEEEYPEVRTSIDAFVVLLAEKLTNESPNPWQIGF